MLDIPVRIAEFIHYGIPAFGKIRFPECVSFFRHVVGRVECSFHQKRNGKRGDHHQDHEDPDGESVGELDHLVGIKCKYLTQFSYLRR